LFSKKEKDGEEGGGDDGKPRNVNAHSLLVPTVDTTHFSFFLKMLLNNRCNIVVRGQAGSGKV
jgi:hypothetical protein